MVIWDAQEPDAPKEELTLPTRYGSYIGAALFEMVSYIMSVVDA